MLSGKFSKEAGVRIWVVL